MRLVQLSNAGRRRVAAVEEPRLRLLDAESVYSLADSAIRAGVKLSEMVDDLQRVAADRAGRAEDGNGAHTALH